MLSAHHQTGGAAAIEVEGIPQSRRAKNLGRLVEGRTLIVDPLQGEQPQLPAIAADHRARCSLAEKGGREPLDDTVQDDAPVLEQERPAADHIGRLPQVVARLADQPQAGPLAPGQGRRATGHQEILSRLQGHARRQRAAVITAPHNPVPHHHRLLRAAEGAVLGAPFRAVPGQPGAHETAVDHPDRPLPAAVIAHPFPQLQPAETGQGGGFPGHDTPIQDRP